MRLSSPPLLLGRSARIDPTPQNTVKSVGSVCQFLSQLSISHFNYYFLLCINFALKDLFATRVFHRHSNPDRHSNQTVLRSRLIFSSVMLAIPSARNSFGGRGVDEIYQSLGAAVDPQRRQGVQGNRFPRGRLYFQNILQHHHLVPAF